MPKGFVSPCHHQAWAEKGTGEDERSKPAIFPMPFSSMFHFSAKKARSFKNSLIVVVYYSRGPKRELESMIIINIQK